tara:strand:+ start:1254 stop:1463 length:210 start_codon:yes stop_codon:yes gene_type:complete
MYNALYNRSKAIMNKEIKYPKGTKVKVCNDLETIIEKVEWIELFNEYKYWFKDENGKLWNESEEAIEKM